MIKIYPVLLVFLLFSSSSFSKTAETTLTVIEKESKTIESNIHREFYISHPTSCELNTEDADGWINSEFSCNAGETNQIISSLIENEISIESYAKTVLRGYRNDSTIKTSKLIKITRNVSGQDNEGYYFTIYPDDEVGEDWRVEVHKIRGKKYFYLIMSTAASENQYGWSNIYTFLKSIEIK